MKNFFKIIKKALDWIMECVLWMLIGLLIAAIVNVSWSLRDIHTDLKVQNLISLQSLKMTTTDEQEIKELNDLEIRVIYEEDK